MLVQDTPQGARVARFLMPPKEALGAIFVFNLVLMAGCVRSNSNTSSRQRQAALNGKAVYDQMCAQCHDATNLHLLKTPPKLKGLFQRPALPSGAPATDQQVEEVIIHGRRTMPAFDQMLSAGKLEDLITYLHTI